MEKTRELTVVIEEKEKATIFLNPAYLLKGKSGFENLFYEGNRRDKIIKDEDIEQAIEAFSRVEKNTLGYAAVCFAPILLILTSLEYLMGLDDCILNYLVGIGLAILSITGIYFWTYKVIFLNPRRIFMEGYRIGLVNSFRFAMTPRGKWNRLNTIMVTLLFPSGYLVMLIAIFRILSL